MVWTREQISKIIKTISFGGKTVSNKRWNNKRWDSNEREHNYLNLFPFNQLKYLYQYPSWNGHGFNWNGCSWFNHNSVKVWLSMYFSWLKKGQDCTGHSFEQYSQEHYLHYFSKYNGFANPDRSLMIILAIILLLAFVHFFHIRTWCCWHLGMLMHS